VGSEIADGNRITQQRKRAPEQRYDDALPQHQLGVDDFFRQRRDIERRQIERRITVGFGTEQGEFAFFDMAALE
jgi:hypothetical protein